MQPSDLSALTGPLDSYLATIRREHAKRKSETSLFQTQLAALIGLCTTVAFAERNRSKDGEETQNSSAEGQLTA